MITYNVYRQKEPNYEEHGLTAFPRITDRPLTTMIAKKLQQ